jgi:hypothetical protein
LWRRRPHPAPAPVAPSDARRLVLLLTLSAGAQPARSTSLSVRCTSSRGRRGVPAAARPHRLPPQPPPRHRVRCRIARRLGLKPQLRRRERCCPIRPRRCRRASGHLGLRRRRWSPPSPSPSPSTSSSGGASAQSPPGCWATNYLHQRRRRRCMRQRRPRVPEVYAAAAPRAAPLQPPSTPTAARPVLPSRDAPSAMDAPDLENTVPQQCPCRVRRGSSRRCRRRHRHQQRQHAGSAHAHACAAACPGLLVTVAKRATAALTVRNFRAPDSICAGAMRRCAALLQRCVHQAYARDDDVNTSTT